MCQGVIYFANNEKALYAKKTVSYIDGAKELKIDEDKFLKFRYRWWEKKIQQVHYDQVAKDVLKQINQKKAYHLVELSVKKNFNTDAKLAKWLKKVPQEWNKLFEPQFYSLVQKVNPFLVDFKKKVERFSEQPIEKYNPYQAKELPSLARIKSLIPKSVRVQAWDQVCDLVWNQIRRQVRKQVWDRVGDQVWDQLGDQLGDKVESQIWNQVGNRLHDQFLGDEAWDQIESQMWSASFTAAKFILDLPIKHWFFNFLELGIIIVFVKGKVKIFGKEGEYLGEYTRREFIT